MYGVRARRIKKSVLQLTTERESLGITRLYKSFVTFACTVLWNAEGRKSAPSTYQAFIRKITSIFVSQTMSANPIKYWHFHLGAWGSECWKSHLSVRCLFTRWIWRPVLIAGNLWRRWWGRCWTAICSDRQTRSGSAQTLPPGWTRSSCSGSSGRSPETEYNHGFLSSRNDDNNGIIWKRNE